MPLWAHGHGAGHGTGASEEMARLLASWRRGPDGDSPVSSSKSGHFPELIELCVQALGKSVALGNLQGPPPRRMVEGGSRARVFLEPVFVGVATSRFQARPGLNAFTSIRSRKRTLSMFRSVPPLPKFSS